MSRQQPDFVDGLIDRAARSIVTGDLPRQVLTRTLSTLDERVERQAGRSHDGGPRWGVWIAAPAIVALVASLVWKDAKPAKGPETKPRQDVVANAYENEPVERGAPPIVETPGRAGRTARRVEPRIPAPVTIEPVSVAVVQVGGVAITPVEVRRVEIARVELESNPEAIVQ